MAYDPVRDGKCFDVDGKWRRASQYALRNGAIVPAPGAQFVDYDPWGPFRKNAGLYRTVEQPYIALLELGRELEAIEVVPFLRGSTGLFPTADAVKEAQNIAAQLVLKWCNQHGLLGLLGTLSSTIRLPAETCPVPEDDCRWVVEQEIYQRNGGSWSSRNVRREISGTTSERAKAAVRKAMKEAPRSGVTWLDGLDHFHKEQPLDEIRPFFPSETPETTGQSFVPPRPGLKDFWANYGEPVELFILWCNLFVQAVDSISGGLVQTSGSQKEESAKLIASQIDRLRSHLLLFELAQAVAPTFRVNYVTNVVDESRKSAGLLASYALMFLWDHMAGRRAIRCKSCQHYFVSNEQRAGYCSPRCRNTAQSRRSRVKRLRAK
jgi:hypothetical protein